MQMAVPAVAKVDMVFPKAVEAERKNKPTFRGNGKIRGYFGTSIKTITKGDYRSLGSIILVEDKISSSNTRTIDIVLNLTKLILAWVSGQSIECLCPIRRCDLREYALRIYGREWERNNDKPFGLVIDRKHKTVCLKFFEFQSKNGVRPKDLVEKDPFFGETIICVVFKNPQLIDEFIRHLYIYCGCRVGHEEVCPLYGEVIEK